MILISIIGFINLILICILSTIEFSFFSANRLKVELDKKQNKRYAGETIKLLQKSDLLLDSFTISKNIFLVIFLLLLTMVSKNLLINTFIAIFILFIFIEVFPRIISINYYNWVLANLWPIVSLVFILFSPLALFLNKIMRKKAEPFSINPELMEVSLLSKESTNEIELIKNALSFPDVILKECLIPRNEICSVSQDASKEEILEKFIESKYSRIIVYKESLDRITGYIHSKDLLLGDKSVDLLIRQIDFVPEEMGAKQLLTKLIKNKSTLAVVIDQYGGTSGIVTLEDLIEEIFGEISDELDKEELQEKVISDTEFIFSARIDIKYLNRQYEFEMPENEDYETLGGLLTYLHENIPVEGDVLYYANYVFTILKTKSNRVDLVSLRIID